MEEVVGRVVEQGRGLDTDFRGGTGIGRRRVVSLTTLVAGRHPDRIFDGPVALPDAGTGCRRVGEFATSVDRGVEVASPDNHHFTPADHPLGLLRRVHPGCSV